MNKDKIREIAKSTFMVDGKLDQGAVQVVKELRALCGALLEDEQETPMPWPPAGMPILVYHLGHWHVRLSAGNGGYISSGLVLDDKILTGDSAYGLLDEHAWKYLPAPPEWPETANEWIATDSGEYRYSVVSGWRVGEVSTHGRILHVERRPEEDLRA